MPKFILPFSKINKRSVNQAGGKGASLGEMTAQKFPVPPGFVVLADAFARYLQQTDLGVEIAAALAKVKPADTASVEEAAEIIRSLIKDTTISADLHQEILAAFRKLRARYVAVRSSATAEDSKVDSWAGELESYLHVTAETLAEKVRECWASLFTPRAIFYRFARRLEKKPVSVAVVVQKMVEADIAGVAFSVHPVTKDHNQLIIEAGWGLGESIVLGKITPDSYVVNKKDEAILDVNISEQEKMIIKQGKGGGVREVAVPAAKKDKQKLSSQQIIQLAKIVKHIEQHYGSPQDVEWACEKGKFYVLQARPITTL